jgi:exopolysaccharide biosynthesis polyprenyl glycosylphosphotransferase
VTALDVDGVQELELEAPSGRQSQQRGTERRWQRRYRQTLVGLDAIVALIAGGVAFAVRFGTVDESTQAYLLMSVLLPLAWVAAVGLARAYEARFLFVGSDEYHRVLLAGLALTSLVAVVSYAFHIDLARGYVLVALPAATLADLAVRYAARKWVHHNRHTQQRFMSKVMLVGYERAIAGMTRQLNRQHYHGMQVVGACLPPHRPYHDRIDDVGIDVYGTFLDVADAVDRAGADMVAVLACPEFDAEALRRLAWQLEKTQVDLLVAPALMDVAGPRTTIRPVDGLPLLHVEHPKLSGGRRLVKELFDRLVAGTALILLSPLLLAIGLAIRFTSPGPALFRQARVGKDGTTFGVYKFRSMYADAEARLAELRRLNEHDGVLFKIRDDPRVTRLGKHLRRYSLDELPQLLNIVRGQMSLVGPRPPLRSEVDQYADDVHRRLVVKPGLTGLWQVSGRSDLSWDESVRLDLRYVENWSLAMDLLILWRTAFAVVKSSGAS